jgi:glycosyltransferase involved in cell wall biosynthesis
MESKLVSILLPVYGDSPYLLDCLKSIELQNGIQKLELIVLLDRVLSRSLKIIEEFKPKFKKEIIVNNIGGLVNSLNLGIQYARGDLIARIDHDDLMSASRLKIQHDFLLQKPEYVLLGSNLNIIDVRGNFVRKTSYPLEHESITIELKKRNVFAHSSVMYRREAVIAAGMYRPFYEGVEDFDLWQRLARVGKMANLSLCLTTYRQHENQMSIKHAKKIWIGTEAINFNSRSGNVRKLVHTEWDSCDTWFKNQILLQAKYLIFRLRRFLTQTYLLWVRNVK